MMAAVDSGDHLCRDIWKIQRMPLSTVNPKDRQQEHLSTGCCLPAVEGCPWRCQNPCTSELNLPTSAINHEKPSVICHGAFPIYLTQHAVVVCIISNNTINNNKDSNRDWCYWLFLFFAVAALAGDSTVGNFWARYIFSNSCMKFSFMSIFMGSMSKLPESSERALSNRERYLMTSDEN